jgi:DDE superfamily endonuclease
MVFNGAIFIKSHPRCYIFFLITNKPKPIYYYITTSNQSQSTTMTRDSERSYYLKKLEELDGARSDFKDLRTIHGDNDSDEDELDEIVKLHKEMVQSRRYLQHRNSYRKYPSLFQDDLPHVEDTTDNIEETNNPPETDILAARKTGAPWLTEMEFRQKYRMTRESFDSILGMIKKHPVFTEHEGKGSPQAAPEHQLMLLLKFLGTEGTGASNPDLRTMFRIGRGTANLYRNRAMIAIRSLRDKAVTWPDETERQQIAERVQKRHCFPNCVGFIDGTLFPLARSPQSKDAPDYLGRKNLYSLSVLIVNDDQRLIRYYLLGRSGSAHDNRVWNNTLLCQNPDTYFCWKL